MPNHSRMSSLPLFVPGDASSQTLVFSKPVLLWASPANPGAAELGGELARAFPGLTVSTVRSPASVPSSIAPSGMARRTRRDGEVTHMLLYLNQNTWLEDDGERLAEQIKQAREDKLKIVMAHENDPEKGGCIFARFFETTPQELINDGLYRDMAHPCFPRDWPHHEARALSCAPRRAALDVSHARSCRCRSCSWQRASARPPRRASTRALRRTSATRGA